MLLTLTRFSDLDGRKLMDLYAEGNLENTDYFYPAMTDKAEALRLVEEGFLSYLRDEFFGPAGSTYRIWEENGVWVSALRLTRVEDGLYYLEALETHPAFRQQGYASRLLQAVLDALKAESPFRLCDCVSKRNEASLRTHLKNGFRIAAEEGIDYLRGEKDERDYGMEYRYEGEEK